jgi:mono/diheme cytochrome c family protein
MARVVGMACLLALLVTACAPERGRVQERIVPTREQQIAEGERAYLRACASCHGTDARGDGPVAPTLKMRPADLTQLANTHGGKFPRTYVEDVVTGTTRVTAHGTSDMPVWRITFGPTSSGAAATAALRRRRWLDGLVDYLETIQEVR